MAVEVDAARIRNQRSVSWTGSSARLESDFSSPARVRPPGDSSSGCKTPDILKERRDENTNLPGGCARPSLPQPPLSRPSTHPAGERGGSRHSSANHSLFSQVGRVEGREKRAGVMRALTPAPPEPAAPPP